jgi:predicted dehydrogenase
VIWRYPDDTLVTFTQINTNAAAPGAKHGEIEFRGTKGTLYVTNGGYQVVPEALSANEVPALSPLDRSLERGHRAGAKPVIEGVEKNSPDATTLHARNFLDCVKSRERCHCDIETGRRSTNAALIGNIALKMNALLEWDAKAERFTNLEAANKHLSYTYRAPYVLPE